MDPTLEGQVVRHPLVEIRPETPAHSKYFELREHVIDAAESLGLEGIEQAASNVRHHERSAASASLLGFLCMGESIAVRQRG